MTQKNGEITGPAVYRCPDCGDPAVQFLVGRGAYCCGCGGLLAPIDPSDPWKTTGWRETPDPNRERIADTTREAVAQAMSGLTRR